MEDTQIRYEITQLSDNGINITLSLIEDIELEAVSQQQIMLEAIDRSISDEEVKKQIKAHTRGYPPFSTTNGYQDLSKNSYSD